MSEREEGRKERAVAVALAIGFRGLESCWRERERDRRKLRNHVCRKGRQAGRAEENRDIPAVFIKSSVGHDYAWP